MIPAQSTLIPRFSIISALGLVNTRWALILPALIYPMGIFLARQYMMTIPTSYDEAAYVDGANRFQIFIHVIVPMSVPALTVVAVLHFLGTWNDFLNALIFLYKPISMTLPLGLNLLKGYHGTGSPAVVLAGVMMSMLVPLMVYIFGQKYLLRGANISGLKS
jgi:multiple sugar transport system permease protein